MCKMVLTCVKNLFRLFCSPATSIKKCLKKSFLDFKIFVCGYKQDYSLF